jgi:hypothetical protein
MMHSVLKSLELSRTGDNSYVGEGARLNCEGAWLVQVTWLA